LRSWSRMKRKSTLLLVIGIVAIILVVVLTVTQIPQMLPTPTPTHTPQWHRVIVFEGSQSELNATHKIETTETFYISGDEWRIRYECESLTSALAPIPAIFSLVVFSENETVVEKVTHIGNTLVGHENWFGVKSNEVSVRTGRGNYHLGILTLNIERWYIIVEAFY